MDLCISQQKFHPLCGKYKCLSSSVDLFQLCWNIPSIIWYNSSGLNHRVTSKVNPRDEFVVQIVPITVLSVLQLCSAVRIVSKNQDSQIPAWSCIALQVMVFDVLTGHGHNTWKYPWAPNCTALCRIGPCQELELNGQFMELCSIMRSSGPW